MSSKNQDAFRDRVTAAFGEGLRRALGSAYERRRAQEAMGAEVSDAISKGAIAVIEAGTGLGKSMAYLIPVLIHRKLGGKRAVVSTYTRSLQNQLMTKDLPLAEKAAGIATRSSVLMGRNNYACKQAVMLRLSSIRTGAGVRRVLQAIAEDDKGELQGIDGIRDLGGRMLGEIAVPRSETSCRSCLIRDDCFLVKARREALISDVVFVNHALLFSHVASGGNLLGAIDVLVVDEAHHLEEVATDSLSLSISFDAVRGGGESLVTPILEEQIKYGTLRITNESPAASRELEAFARELNIDVRKADTALRRLFKFIGARCSSVLGASSPEARAPERTVPYSGGSPLFYDLEEQLSELKDCLGRIGEKSEETLACLAFECGMPDGLAGMLESLSLQAREIRDKLSFLVSAEDEDFVYFLKLGLDGAVSEISAAPLDISAQLGSILDETSDSAVLTSATLAINGDFDYTLRKTGLLNSNRLSVSKFESPFKLSLQQKILIASFLPEPGQDDYLREVAETLYRLSAATGRRMLVLCTSRAQVDYLNRLLARYPGMSERILAQTSSSVRVMIMEEFRRSRGKILLGLSSFWEGVDLPGDLLELVVILKMPFLVPENPIVNARARKLQREGSDAFADYFLPDAILKLKQGIGRLIRSGSDRGVVVLLDSRLCARGYGSAVLGSITGQWRICGSMEELLFETVDMMEPGGSA